jgi:hypothetical protein
MAYNQYEQKILGYERQQKLADELRKQSEMPQGQMIGQHYVAANPLSQLGALLRGYAGIEMEDKANKGIETTRAEQGQALKDWQARMPTTRTEEMAGPYSPEQGINAPTRTTKPTAEDYMQWAQQGMTIDPAYAQAGMQSANLQLTRESNEANRRLALESETKRDRERAQDRSDQIRLAASLRPAPQEKMIPVMGPNGTAVYVPAGQAAGQQPWDAKLAGLVNQREQNTLSAQQALDQAAMLYGHPGKNLGTGATSFMSSVPGTDARGFKANLDTFKAQTFIPMVSALKGMGALSDAEGKKLSDSVGALDPGMKTEEFDRSLRDITNYLYQKGKTAGLNVNLPDFAVSQQQTTPTAGKRGGSVAGNAKFLGFE